MISCIACILCLILPNSECFLNTEEIYLDAINSFMSINIEDNSYISMWKNNQHIIFTSENKDIGGFHDIKLSEDITYKINILTMLEIDRLIEREHLDDLLITRINPPLINGKKITMSFSTLVYTKLDRTKYWVDSDDKLGIYTYLIDGECWKPSN